MPTLSIVVPARNEAENVERCVASLLAQCYPDFEVIVVDDESTDATRPILDGIARAEPRLRVIAGAPLPSGWVGKPWALAQGARAARGAWLLFTDADTVHEANAAASAMACALGGEYGVVSLLTDQETVGIAERVVLPSILLIIFLGVCALDDVNDPNKSGIAIFNGQYILASRVAYDGIGGHAAVREEIAEDLELARLFKRDGRFKTFVAGSSGLVRTRMYRTFGEIWFGFVKNFALGARGHAASAAAGITLLACISPLSPIWLVWLLVRGSWTAAALLATAAVAALLTAEYAMRQMRFRSGSGLALPLGTSVALAIFTTSLFSMLSGRGVRWRGRRYGGGLRGKR